VLYGWGDIMRVRTMKGYFMRMKSTIGRGGWLVSLLAMVWVCGVAEECLAQGTRVGISAPSVGYGVTISSPGRGSNITGNGASRGAGGLGTYGGSAGALSVQMRRSSSATGNVLGRGRSSAPLLRSSMGTGNRYNSRKVDRATHTVSRRVGRSPAKPSYNVHGLGSLPTVRMPGRGAGLKPTPRSQPTAKGGIPNASSTMSSDKMGTMVKPTTPVLPQSLNINAQHLSAPGTARSYLAALQSDQSRVLKKGDDEVVSLATEVPGTYRDLMLRGEKAFRRGRDYYGQAIAAFELASELSMNQPESLLSLFHTQFALGSRSYGMASYYLRETLERFPELPLVNIKVRSFYGNTADYVSDLVRLEGYIREKPFDPDARFVYAYLLLREGNTKKAAKMLALALAYARDSNVRKEAIHTLWDGMVVGKMVTGELKPADVDLADLGPSLAERVAPRPLATPETPAKSPVKSPGKTPAKAPVKSPTP
jgi:hypothetical protein